MVVEGGVVGAGGDTQRWWVGVGVVGRAGAAHLVVDTDEEQGVVKADGGDVVAVAARDALDESVQA